VTLPVLTDPTAGAERATWVSRGRRLTWTTLGYNVIEAAVAVGAGASAGSVALLGFGIDSVIEVSASAASLWRLGRDADPAARAHAERVARRVIGASFLALAVYIGYDAGRGLWLHEKPHASPVGMALSAISLVVMPLLAAAKRRVGRALSSRAVEAEAKQTDVCAWLSGIVLGGLALNAVFGWWWADPVAGLAMVPLIVREGLEGLRGRSACGCDSCGDVRV
jgi:cation diffusion facilitator family transporter